MTVKYKIIHEKAVRREDPNGEIWAIPTDLTNNDYKDYLKWLEEGNTPEPADKVDE